MNKREISILVVDDDRDVLTSARIYLKQFYSLVTTTESPDDIPGLIERHSFDIILLDMNFRKGKNDGSEGISWLKKIKEQAPSTIVIMITAYGDINLAISSIKNGAHDFVVKPWQNEKLQATINSAYKLWELNSQLTQAKSREEHLSSDLAQEYSDFIYTSLPMSRLNETLKKIAPTDSEVLISGENGTGKELIARELHKLSGRSNMPFVRVDLGAIPESLFESELFGHKKGAFTGAIRDRSGYFEIASGGTLFLDEIGNIPVHLQNKLLYALEKHEIMKPGEERAVKINPRVISATNMDLNKLVRTGLFKEDLLYRLNMFELRVPALRDRPDDIPLLLDHYVKKYGKKHRKEELKVMKSVINQLRKYSWPGNIRELSHAVERAVILSENKMLEYTDFLPATSLIGSISSKENLNLVSIERDSIQKSLAIANGNITLAAKMLGITRTSLYRRIKKYGI